LGITFDTTAGLHHGVGDPSVREAFLADVRAEMKIMEKIECPSLIVMSGNLVPGISPQQQHASCVEGLKRAAELVEGKGVTLLLENIDLEENPHYYLWSVPEAFKIVEEVNHPQVKFLYDFFHAQISGGNLIASLQRHADKVGLVHIADVPGRHDPGSGEINYLNIYKKLAELNYQHYVAMEYLPLGDTVKSLAHARQEALEAAVAHRS
jgi:hydroxypyruvate isomerase